MNDIILLCITLSRWNRSVNGTGSRKPSSQTGTCRCGQKGRRHSCARREDVGGGKFADVVQFSRSILFLFAFSGTCRKESLLCIVWPGGSWNFRPDTTFRALGDSDDYTDNGKIIRCNPTNRRFLFPDYE